jgi:hypothetical protein
MDFVKKAMGGDETNQQGQGEATTQGSTQGGQQEGGGFFSSLGNKVNEAAGGGRESEKNEDYLDKGMFALRL